MIGYEDFSYKTLNDLAGAYQEGDIAVIKDQTVLLLRDLDRAYDSSEKRIPSLSVFRTNQGTLKVVVMNANLDGILNEITAVTKKYAVIKSLKENCPEEFI